MTILFVREILLLRVTCRRPVNDAFGIVVFMCEYRSMLSCEIIGVIVFSLLFSNVILTQ